MILHIQARKQQLKSLSKRGKSVKSMAARNKFPIGDPLIGISIVEETFGGDELCIDRVELIFQKKTIVMTPIVETDEIEIETISTVSSELTKTPPWGDFMIGKKLQMVWVCKNSQGYKDQILFAFDRLEPSIAFISEGSVIKAFHYKQIYKKYLIDPPKKKLSLRACSEILGGVKHLEIKSRVFKLNSRPNASPLHR